MKMLKRILPIAALSLLAGTAMAAVDNSHHDLKTYASLTEVCYFCHGVTATSTMGAAYGAVGDLCLARCHNDGGYSADANVVPNRPAFINSAGSLVPAGPSVDAVNMSLGYGHGAIANNLYVSNGSVVEAFQAAGQALPYASTGTLQCTTCHNVHDNQYTPFLQMPLANAGAGQSFCETCHAGRGNNWAAAVTAPNGEHPVNFTLAAAGVVNRVDATSINRRSRYIAVDNSGSIFDVVTNSGTAMDGNADHYKTGGHLGGFVNQASGTGKFGCYTCHSAHMPTSASTANPNLIVAANKNGAGDMNPICVGCHGSVGSFTNDPNPGNSSYYHPVGSAAYNGNAAAGIGNVLYLASTNAFSFYVDLTTVQNLVNQGSISDNVYGIETTTYKPRCTTCHDPHGGQVGSMALAVLAGTPAARQVLTAAPVNICATCHTGAGLPDVADNTGGAGETANVHHRTHVGDWSTATVQTADGAGNELLNMANPSWLAGAAMTDGLGCSDCHVFLDKAGATRSTAHNW